MNEYQNDAPWPLFPANMAPMNSDVIIVGAGIIGAAVARELAAEGMEVVLLERQQPATEATWAAAGMLAPSPEAEEFPSMVPLSRASLDLYPEFVAGIEAESGIRVGLQRKGALLAFFGPDGEKERSACQAGLGRLGFVCQPLSGDEVRRREPALNREVTASLWLCDEAIVDNRTLGRAVVVAAQRRGAVVRHGTEVSQLLLEGNRCRGVIAAGERIPAAHVVIAAGCFSGRIGSLGQFAPTRPVRGQMVALDPGSVRPATAIRSKRGYLVPREDGRVLAGSTLEDAGYDKSVTPQGLRRILDAAVELAPALNNAPILETWSGLRPDSPDHLPILGPTSIEGLSIATGHYRNGILLAPITAKLAKQWLLKQHTDLPLDSFSPLRFRESAQAQGNA